MGLHAAVDALVHRLGGEGTDVSDGLKRAPESLGSGTGHGCSLK